MATPAVPGTLNITSPTGKEIISAAGVAPQSSRIILSQARDAAGYQKVVPLTAFTLTFGDNQSIMALNPAGTLATGTITLPANPVDGQRALIFSSQTQTALTLNANTGQSINNAVTALTANVAVEYIYSASNTTWDRCQ